MDLTYNLKYGFKLVEKLPLKIFSFWAINASVLQIYRELSFNSLSSTQ